MQSPPGVVVGEDVKFGDDSNFYGELTLVTIEDDEGELGPCNLSPPPPSALTCSSSPSLFASCMVVT